MLKGIMKKTMKNNVGNPPEFPKVNQEDTWSVKRHTQTVRTES